MTALFTCPIERPQPAWPLTRIIALLYRRTGDRADLAAMADLPELAEGWRVLARRRLERNAVEDWSKRLAGD
jgi:MOSC domain-containing protein YiiM